VSNVERLAVSKVERPILGWDVGGANVKAARIDGEDRGEPAVLARPFPLWREAHHLPAVLAEAANHLGLARTMAVTMTAELADCFANKREGVSFVLDAFRTAFPDSEQWVFGVDGRFRSVEAARKQPYRVAAANWMASAAFVAGTHRDAIFLDVGSTTTDVIPIVNGRVTVRGRTDPSRLRSGELVYTGALRTPVCAIVRTLPLRGRKCRVAAEHFAVAADAHLWLGHIDERDYTCETPDGRGATRLTAGARLARMVCADLEMISTADITAIAEHVAETQIRHIASGVRQVMRRLGPSCPGVAVLAGQGAFLAQAAAQQAGLSTIEMSEAFGPAAARVAPAAAVAYLLADALAISSRSVQD